MMILRFRERERKKNTIRIHYSLLIFNVRQRIRRQKIQNARQNANKIKKNKNDKKTASKNPLKYI